MKPPVAVPPISIPLAPTLGTTWPGLFQSHRRVVDHEMAEVEGELPEQLSGTFLASGPSIFTIIGRPAESWFDGQGAIHRVSIADGRATCTSRLVESDDIRKERDERYAPKGRFSTKGHDNALMARVDSTNLANTQPLRWGDRLFAMYEAGHPVELDPATLQSWGDTDLGLLKKREHFSAHPHRTVLDRATWNFSLGPSAVPGKIDLSLLRLPDGGKKVERIATVKLSYYPFLHDFIMAGRFAVFLIPPVLDDVAGMIFRHAPLGDTFQWWPDWGTQVVVIDTRTGAVTVNAFVQSFFLWHHANGWVTDDGGSIVLDYAEYADYERDVKDFTFSVHKGRYPSSVRGSRLVRARIDLAAAAAYPDEPDRWWSKATLWDKSSEFPRVSPHADGVEHRFIYTANHSSDHASYHCLWDAATKLEVVRTARGTVVKECPLPLESEQWPTEPIFVPRPQPLGEDDGWVLALVYDGRRDRSFLAVWDAVRPGDGPLARIWWPVPLPMTFHRIWIPREGGQLFLGTGPAPAAARWMRNPVLPAGAGASEPPAGGPKRRATQKRAAGGALPPARTASKAKAASSEPPPPPGTKRGPGRSR